MEDWPGKLILIKIDSGPGQRMVHLKLSADKMAAGKKVLFPPWLVGLFIFVGHDPKTGIQGYINVINFAFSCEMCLQGELVGAVPLTCTCLIDPKVKRKVRDSSQEDVMQIAMTDVQEANTKSCNILQCLECDGSLLRATLSTQKEKVAVTVSHS